MLSNLLAYVCSSLICSPNLYIYYYHTAHTHTACRIACLPICVLQSNSHCYLSMLTFLPSFVSYSLYSCTQGYKTSYFVMDMFLYPRHTFYIDLSHCFCALLPTIFRIVDKLPISFPNNVYIFWV